MDVLSIKRMLKAFTICLSHGSSHGQYRWIAYKNRISLGVFQMMLKQYLHLGRVLLFMFSEKILDGFLFFFLRMHRNPVIFDGLQLNKNAVLAQIKQDLLSWSGRWNRNMASNRVKEEAWSARRNIICWIHNSSPEASCHLMLQVWIN